MTSSNENIFRVTGPLCGEFTGLRWIPRTKASDSDAEHWCFLWSAAWINGWVNNDEAGDLRRNHSHYDVIVMRNDIGTFGNFIWQNILNKLPHHPYYHNHYNHYNYYYYHYYYYYYYYYYYCYLVICLVQIIPIYVGCYKQENLLSDFVVKSFFPNFEFMILA